MPSIFLSYDSEDKPFVDKLTERLESQGVTVWRDVTNLLVGDPLTAIGEAIEQTDFVGIVLSYYSINSPWVQKEFEIALLKEIELQREFADQKNIIIPLLLDSVEIPPFLRSRLYADFTDPDKFEPSFQKLCVALDVPYENSSGQSPWKVISTLVVVSALVIFIGYKFWVKEPLKGVKNTPFAQPVASLAPLIVEPVAPIDLLTSPVVISAEQAIREYYLLIGQEKYEVTWEMLSDEFKREVPVATFDDYKQGWEETGPAEIIELVKVIESTDNATITITLHYPKKMVTHTLNYTLIRDFQNGDQRFGYWLFVVE